MKDLGLVWPSGADRWRKPTIVALSVGLHVLILGLLGWRALGLGGPVQTPEFVIQVDIEPRPLLPGETSRVRPPPALPETEAPPLTGSPTAAPSTPFRNAEEEEQRPLAPSPRPAAPGAPAPPADVGTAAWQVRPETTGDRVGRGLRTGSVGCASPNLLSQQERTLCEDRFGQRAAAAAPIEGTGNPERDARFAREGARALAEYEDRRRPLSGGVGVVGPQDGPGSNFGMGVAGAHLDPALRPDSTTNVRTRRDRVREREED